MSIKEKIQNALIGSKFEWVEQITDILYGIVGKPCRCYDSGIDDGADGDETEDQYVLYASFEFENSDLCVKVYYGDVTREIGYVAVDEN